MILNLEGGYDEPSDVSSSLLLNLFEDGRVRSGFEWRDGKRERLGAVGDDPADVRWWLAVHDQTVELNGSAECEHGRTLHH